MLKKIIVSITLGVYTATMGIYVSFIVDYYADPNPDFRSPIV
jgi:hypothetical protein